MRPAPPEPAPAVTPALDRLAYQLLADLNMAVVHEFLELWPAGPARRPSPSCGGLPVLRRLPEVVCGAPEFSKRFLVSLGHQSAQLCWRQTYSGRQVPGAFLEGYGYAELVGLTGALESKRVACGVLLLGPHVNYPPHRHEAEEIYVVLAGNSSWRKSAEAWRHCLPGELIHHARHEPHAMRTHGDAMLALYLWRSADLDQKSQLV